MRRIFTAWWRNGSRGAWHALRSRLTDWRIERSSGLRTGGLIAIETLVNDWHGCHDYFPTGYAELRAVLATLDCRPDDMFIDIGAGKGRALLVAAERPFGAVVGVEISSALCVDARANVARYGGGLACRDIRVVEVDAAEWPIPHEATLIYLYNPFHGARLERLFDAIGASLDAAPRALRIVFHNPRHFEPIEGNYPWLRREAVYALEYRWIVYSVGSPGITDEIAA